MNMLYKTETGSVLMETVLVIPLYLALLSGIFWIGDLALLRSKITFFDRFAAWGSGNRHGQRSSGASQDLLEMLFLRSAKVGKQNIVSVNTAGNHPANSWSSIVGASTVVSIEPPVWTDAWRRSALTLAGVDGSSLRRLTFRSREVSAPLLHRNLMRAKNDFREKSTPQTLAERQEWLNRVYGSPWPDEWTERPPSSVSGSNPCLKYERHHAFVQWSE
jgi:hypothetical protein